MSIGTNNHLHIIEQTLMNNGHSQHPSDSDRSLIKQVNDENQRWLLILTHWQAAEIEKLVQLHNVVFSCATCLVQRQSASASSTFCRSIFTTSRSHARAFVTKQQNYYQSRGLEIIKLRYRYGTFTKEILCANYLKCFRCDVIIDVSCCMQPHLPEKSHEHFR